MSLEEKAQQSANKIAQFALDTFEQDGIDALNAVAILQGIRLFIIKRMTGLSVDESNEILREVDV